MTRIPLVNSNSVNDINTSIIAIKKEISSTGNTDVNVTVNLPENSIPVDAVTDGDMHAVTSNAVFENCLKVETVTGTTDVGGGTYIIKKVGKIVTLDIFGCSLPTGTLYTLFTIPQRFRYSRMMIAQGFNGSGSVDRTHMLGYVIDQNGEVNVNTSDMPLESSFPQLHTIWIID